MEYTTLGKTGLKVSVAGLGTGGFSRLGLKAGKSEDESARLIHEAVGLGINFIDTAPALRHRGGGGEGAEIPPAAIGRRRHQGVRSSQRRMVDTRARGREPGQFAAFDGDRLRRRVQSARRVRTRVPPCPGEDRAGAAGAEGEGQDQAYRHHREPDRRPYQRDAEARGAGPGLGGLHGGLPHDAPGRPQECVPDHAARRASARC